MFGKRFGKATGDADLVGGDHHVDRLHSRCQVRVFSQLHQPPVKVTIGLKVTANGRRRRVFGELPKHLLQFINFFTIDPVSSYPGGHRFETLTHFEDLGHFPRGEALDIDGAAGQPFEKTFLGKAFQGVDKGRAADPHVAGKLLLQDPLSRFELTLGDHGLEALVDLVIKIVVLDDE